jgi:hypothetical protein
MPYRTMLAVRGQEQYGGFVSDPESIDEVGKSRFLRVIISRNTTRTLYRVSIRFDLLGPDIAAVEERHDVAEAIHDAFVAAADHVVHAGWSVLRTCITSARVASRTRA